MTTIRPFLVGNLCFAGVVLLGACGGSPPPSNGYAEGEGSPWDKAGTLRLNDNLEATAEGELSYPGRKRARWYMVDLPAPGKIVARVSTDTQVKGADIGMEILDAGFNVNAEGQNDDDVAQPKKAREFKEARAGKSYIHLYTLGSADVIAYTLRVRFEPKPQTARTEPAPEPLAGPDKTKFPWTVPNTPTLPGVGKTGGGGGSKEPPPPPPDPNAGFNIIRGTIIEFGQAGSGVRIVINKGTNASLDANVEGDVLRGGKPMPSGHFKIRSCHDSDCEAVAPKATMDEIQANRQVLIKIPK